METKDADHKTKDLKTAADHYVDLFFRDVIQLRQRLGAVKNCKESIQYDKSSEVEVNVLEMRQFLSTEDNIKRFEEKFKVDASGPNVSGVAVFFVIFVLKEERDTDNSDDEFQSESIGPLYTNFEKKGTVRTVKFWTGQTLHYPHPLRIIYPFGVQNINKQYLTDGLFARNQETGTRKNKFLELYFASNGFLQNNFDASLSLNLMFIPNSDLVEMSEEHADYLEKKYAFSPFEKGRLLPVDWRELQEIQIDRADRRIVQQELRKACKSGSVTEVKMVLKKVPDDEIRREIVNWGDECYFNWTALHITSWEGQRSILKIFLQQKLCDSNTIDDDHQTALHLASWRGHYKVVRLLRCEDECEINQRDLRCRTPLHLAADEGHDRVVRELMQSKRCDLNMTEESNLTPLHLASGRGHHRVVKKLLRSEMCDISIMDKSGRTALQLAAEKGHARVVKKFFQSEKFWSAEINLSDREEDLTPLQWAARDGYGKLVRELLLNDQQCDVNAQQKKRGRTALHLALLNDHEEIVKILFNNAKSDLGKVDIAGFTPLKAALVKDNHGIVKILVEGMTRNYVKLELKDKLLQNILYRRIVYLIKSLVLKVPFECVRRCIRQYCIYLREKGLVGQGYQSSQQQRSGTT